MLRVAVRAAGYTYMALCSFNIQKSTLLLIWKIINTSKACCSLASCFSHFASSCFILQVEMHSCWNSLILNLSNSVNNSWCSLHLKMLVECENILVYKKNPSVGYIASKLLKYHLWIQFVYRYLCLCTHQYLQLLLCLWSVCTSHCFW